MTMQVATMTTTKSCGQGSPAIEWARGEAERHWAADREPSLGEGWEARLADAIGEEPTPQLRAAVRRAYADRWIELILPSSRP
jgi:hypothetical protein